MFHFRHLMMMRPCQDHILTENIWFVWSRNHIVEISGDVTDAGRKTTDDEQGKIELLSQWMLDG